MNLITTPNIDDPDEFYAALLAAHKGLDSAQSAALDARLVLILANHAGDRKVLDQALKLATETGTRDAGEATRIPPKVEN